MDPISLLLLFGSGALIGFATRREFQNQQRDQDIVIRRVYETFDGWICTELMSAQALNLVGQIMDMDLLAWWPKVESESFQVIIITQPGAPIDRQIIVLLEKGGDYGWSLSEAYHHGYRKVDQRIDYQRIDQLLQSLNTDPADVVVRTAVEMTDPVRRYEYLRYALTANPELSALLSRDDQFVDVVRRTVKAPAVVDFKAAQKGPVQRQLPYTPDLQPLRRNREAIIEQAAVEAVYGNWGGELE